MKQNETKQNETKQNETKKLNPVRDDISVEKRLHIKNQSRMKICR
jgi:hypothetical protein